jgi:predicted nuclease of predicted toxin-antitoxin system
MKFLLDMGLAHSTGRYLRDSGHDAVHLRDQELQRLPDSEIVAKAVAEQRIILTHDLDFGRIVSLSKARVPSVVTFRLADMRAGEVNRQLYELITRFAAAMENGALISVTDQGIRVRHLPSA